MGYCRYFGRIGDLEVIQVLWPDSTGKSPFEVGGGAFPVGFFAVSDDRHYGPGVEHGPATH